ncbi:aconitate hydratase [Anopheles sinensis]|uniref:Aconitate hydratase n=1 Tax=Anopheles sinensis TaxID=74873 RepID=A0A084VFJ2_ANOSI|nr:aconitate hydratase [Anopheles sinensis]
MGDTGRERFVNGVAAGCCPMEHDKYQAHRGTLASVRFRSEVRGFAKPGDTLKPGKRLPMHGSLRGRLRSIAFRKPTTAAGERKRRKTAV